MKYLILLLLLTGCGRSFQIGDCIKKKELEKWQVGNEYIILDIGHDNYKNVNITIYNRMYQMSLESSNLYVETDSFSLIEREYVKIDCPWGR